MLYAKVVVGLPVEGPFDYSLPHELEGSLSVGSRVWVNFANRKVIAYVVGFSGKTNISAVKPIVEAIDSGPLLSDELLCLTKELADYYCCSWGEAISTALPAALRSGKKIPACKALSAAKKTIPADKIIPVLVHNPLFLDRWGIYLEQIKKTIANKRSVIILLPDMQSLAQAALIVRRGLDIDPHILHRKDADELKQWSVIRQIEAPVVMGLRSAVFAPAQNLGLIVIDEEQNFVYKQDQVPHYNAREIAFMRARIEGAGLVLGGVSASVEMMYLAAEKKIGYIGSGTTGVSLQVTLVDSRSLSAFSRKDKTIISKLLEDAIFSSLKNKEKILLFLNRKGFATSATCISCGFAVKCPRCNINLTYHQDEEKLNCPYCSYKAEPPKICPHCNAGYIRYSGVGTEKLQSQLNVIFPCAAIKRTEKTAGLNLAGADIFISTSAITKEAGVTFDLVGVVSIDHTLNYPDLRSSENVFAILSHLSAICTKKMIIQTAIPEHHCFQALLKKDAGIFYEAELRQRKELKFPPFRHLIALNLRGSNDEKVKKSAQSLFEKLSNAKKSADIRLVSLNPASRPKLRGNFYRQIIIACRNVAGANKFLKLNLKNFPRSGIIVKVDVDPV